MKKIIVISIIVLFVGMVFQPAYAVETIPKADKIEQLEDCYCQEVDRVNIVRVKFLFNRLKVFTNILLVRFGNMPEVKEKSKELLEVVDSNRQLDFPIFPRVCDFLEGIIDNLSAIFDYIFELMGKYPNSIIIECICNFIWLIAAFLLIPIAALHFGFGCDPPPPSLNRYIIMK
jgi:hypothetical protein